MQSADPPKGINYDQIRLPLGDHAFALVCHATNSGDVTLLAEARFED